MNRIVIESPGFFSTVQDLGREGFGQLGVSAAGAADAISLRLGNLLLGNVENSPAVEMTLIGGTFFFPDGATIALTGSDFDSRLDDKPLGRFESIQVGSGRRLRLGPSRSGARCYLCVRGGILAPKTLGSASAHTLSGLGGRRLSKGDTLPIGEDASEFPLRKINPRLLPAFLPRKQLRVTPGPQEGWFKPAALRIFYRAPYGVVENSDRMGLRLLGPTVDSKLRGDLKLQGDMITEGVSLGAIQITPEGQPIILFVDQQTTGGYPKVANVIAVDIASVGQLRPRDQIRFEKIGFEAARDLFLAQQQALASKELIV